jgi:hypothetical protein
MMCGCRFHRKLEQQQEVTNITDKTLTLIIQWSTTSCNSKANQFSKYDLKRQRLYYVTLRHVRLTIFPAEKQIDR